MQNIWFDVYDNESFNLIAFCDFSIIICVYLFVINTNKLLLEVHFYYRIFVSITVFLFQLPYFFKLNKLWRYFMRPCFYTCTRNSKTSFGLLASEYMGGERAQTLSVRSIDKEYYIDGLIVLYACMPNLQEL